MHETYSSSMTFCELFTCKLHTKGREKEGQMLPGKKEKASERKEYVTLVLKEEVEFSDERHFMERKA